MKNYTITVAENVRRYTTYSVELTPEQAETLMAHEQEDLDADPDVVDLLGDVTEGAMCWEDARAEVCDQAETVIIGVDEDEG